MTNVTRESLQQMLDNPNPKYVEAVIGRATTALFKYQTTEEQQLLETRHHNGVGFNSADANVGSRTAKSWMRSGKLEPWQIALWTKKNPKGISRLTKYHRQLNAIASTKK